MADFYFTFAGNVAKDGTLMAHYWVRVSIPNADGDMAKRIFIKHFAFPIMGKPFEWSNQFKEEQFHQDLYPRGEYMHIDASDDPRDFL